MELYDFEGATEVVQNFDHYADMGHYGLAINQQILRWLKAGRYRLTGANFATHLAEVVQRTHRFAADIQRPEHSLHAELQLSQLKLDFTLKQAAQDAENAIR